MATRGPVPGSSRRRIQVLIAGEANAALTRAFARDPRRLSHPLRTLFAWSSTSSSPPSGRPPSSSSPTSSAPGPPAPATLAADERVTAALEQQAALLAQQAAQLEARLGMEREHTVTAAADMAAKMAGEKLGDSMTSGTRQLDLRTTAFEKRVEGLTTQLERLGDVVAKLQQDSAQQHGQLVSGLRAGHRPPAACWPRPPATSARPWPAPRPAASGASAWPTTCCAWPAWSRASPTASRRPSPAGAIPDVTFMLPGGRELHMDVKFPVDNYLRHLEADTDAERETTAKAFLRDVRGRVKELSTRGYIDPDATLDEVLLFIPNESVWAFIHEQRPGAHRRRPRARRWCCARR